MALVKIGDKGERAIHANRCLMGHNVFAHQTLWHNQDHKFTAESGKATKQMKWWLGYKKESCDEVFGPLINDYLVGKKKLSIWMHIRRRQRNFEKKFHFPVVVKGWTKLGYPGQGTHSWIVPPNNWESDNAIDIGCPAGTPVVAVANGIIGEQFGPLGTNDPRFAGIRLHLATSDSEFYYAHLKDTAFGIAPGAKVKRGQLLGHSGVANGVGHLHLGMKNGNPANVFFG